MKTIKLLLITLMLTTSLQGLASELSNVGLFYRCYSQITGEFPSKDDKKLKEVQQGKDPITACLEVFDLALFANGTSFLANFNNETAQAVLRTMHTLHYSWFETNLAPEINNEYITNTRNVFDPSSSATYFTKALFDQQSQFKDVVLGTTTYRPVRVTNIPPVSTWNLIPTADYIFTDVQFAGAGVLLGMEVLPVNDTMDYSFNNNQTGPPDIRTGTLTYNTHFGGGVLGSQPYLLQTIQATSLNPKYNGGGLTTRKWSRAVFHDILCRELPVVRETDGAAFVDVESPLGFRKSMGCVKCHTTIDRMGGVTRGVTYNSQIAGNFFNQGSSAFISARTVDKPAAEIFPTSNDDIYFRRPTQGHLFYREHDGKLVDLPIDNVEQLGLRLSQEDGMYNCLAKRYYQFFTGIDVSVGDIADPHHPTLSQEEQNVRNIILGLGQELKTHQNPRTLIEKILRRPEYKKSNFNLGSIQ